MSTIAFFSAKGAPGATTAAMLVASLWPRPALLVDADPAGGDVALRLPSPQGRPLDQSTGMLSLLPLARRNITAEQVLAHAQQVLGGGEVIAGLAAPEQAAAAGPVWSGLAEVISHISSHDVVIDVGRLSADAAVLPLAQRADVAVLVTRDTVSGVFAARARLRTLVAALTDANGSGPQLGLLVHSTAARGAESAASVIRAEFPQIRYLGWLASDAAGVRMFDGERVSRPERTMIVRAGREVVRTLDGALRAIESLRAQAQVRSDPHAAPDPAIAKPRSRSEERAAQRHRFARRRREASA